VRGTRTIWTDLFLLDTTVELAISFPRRSFGHACRMALCETC
jgi:hypothetical protein